MRLSMLLIIIFAAFSELMINGIGKVFLSVNWVLTKPGVITFTSTTFLSSMLKEEAKFNRAAFVNEYG